MVKGIPAARGPVRTQADACPGALRPHHAADGELVRLRLPGGALPAPVLRSLSVVAADLGDGRLHLTSRGNLQIRGLSAADVEPLADRAAGLGLLPSSSHERVRNIITSPLGGPAIDQLVDELDRGLCARPALAELPGRFLFAVDDGSGDVAGEGADVLLRATGGGRFEVRTPAGSREVDTDQAVAAALDEAAHFLATRHGAWRIAEVFPGSDPPVGSDRGKSLDAGILDQADGRLALCAVVPLGALSEEQAEALAAAAGLGDDVVRVTPWRRVVLRDLELPGALAARELLAAVGLVVEPGTSWGRITACAGRPGCAKSLTDVHADAAAFAAGAAGAGPAVHWVGCDRGCGTPSGQVVRVGATPGGYRIEHGDLLGLTERTWIGAR